MILIKRIYDPYSPDDGYRVLVDRLWPRGIAKATSHLDLWLKDIAPSTTLRHWFNHDPAKWPGFQKKYQQELARKPGLVAQLKSFEAQHHRLTLLYAAKDTDRNEAVVLQQWLQKKSTVAPVKKS
ncbi:DUF488 domain-containing protein [Patescibacteria group bacterium]|nr:DUF488 domain-containing protein [Patescibacteria group bacterium]